MNKDEALNKIIEYCKNGSKTPVSDFCRIPCSVCPFNDDNCENVIADVLTERLIKAEEKADSLEETCYKLQQALEEKKETNFDHYVSDYWIYRDGYQVIFNLRSGWKESLSDFGDGTDIMNWFKLPYEEPKPKYKLSKFEHDLLDSYFDKKYGIKNSFMLDTMRKKGYFKGVPTDMPIKDVLDNCEVIQND